MRVSTLMSKLICLNNILILPKLKAKRMCIDKNWYTIDKDGNPIYIHPRAI